MNESTKDAAASWTISLSPNCKGIHICTWIPFDYILIYIKVVQVGLLARPMVEKISGAQQSSCLDASVQSTLL